MLKTPKKKTEVRQKEIKKALLKTISENGIRCLSTRMLAAKIGISEAAIFRHYSSKANIIDDIIKDVNEELVGKLTEISRQKTPALKRLFDVLDYQIKYLMANDGVTVLLFSEAVCLQVAKLKKKLMNVFLSQRNAIYKIISDGIKNGEFGKSVKADDVATFYMGIPTMLSMGVVLNEKKEFDIENFSERMFSLLSKILEAKAGK